MDKNWYAVYTKPRWEKKIAEVLTKKKFENYCPLNRVQRQWHDRKKTIYAPLFTSYVFVRAEEKQQTEIKNVDGIINLVYWLKKPAIISVQEIDTIKKFLNDYGTVHLEKAEVNVNVNDTVRILSGPLMNQEGNIISVGSKLAKVSLPSLGYMMVAQVEKQNIKVIINKNSDNYAAIR
jgi:transcription antitermination factor NusG